MNVIYIIQVNIQISNVSSYRKYASMQVAYYACNISYSSNIL